MHKYEKNKMQKQLKTSKKVVCSSSAEVKTLNRGKEAYKVTN